MRRRFLTLLQAALTAASVHAAPLEVEVVDAKGVPLEGAVVWVESAAARAAVRPEANAEIAQEKRQFLPKVAVVSVGTSVAFPNRDTVRHHVYSVSPAKPFDRKLYAGREASPVLFDRPGVAVLGCNIHDEMIGWVVVVESPWYGRSAATGQLRLDVPPGAHRLLAWHPDLPVGAPATEQAVAVGAGTTTARLRVAVEPTR